MNNNIEDKAKKMKIYIGSSWKNQHGVEMLTALLRSKGHEVVSWIENNFLETYVSPNFSFNDWLKTDGAFRSFDFDTEGAANCDLFILYTYAGNDAHAEMALAWQNKIPIIGLHQKGYEPGLMSKMVLKWYYRYTELLEAIEEYS